MVGLCPRERVEDCGSLELARIRLVRQIDRLVERERIEHGSFGVLRIPLVKLRHRRFVLRSAGFLIERVVACEEDAERFNPIAFALCRWIRGASLLDGLPAGLQERLGKWREQRIRDVG